MFFLRFLVRTTLVDIEHLKWLKIFCLVNENSEARRFFLMCTKLLTLDWSYNYPCVKKLFQKFSDNANLVHMWKISQREKQVER